MNEKVSTINFEKFGEEISKYNLTCDNIIDFFIEEDNDIFKYMLKTYILSVIEDYKHLNKLKKYLFYEKNFDPVHEIITRKIDKPFWKEILNYNNESFEFYYGQEYIYEYLKNFVYIDEYKKVQNELNKKIIEEKNVVKRLKIKQKAKKYETELINKQKKVKKNYPYKGSLLVFENMLKKYLKEAEKIVKEEVEWKKNIDVAKEINNFMSVNVNAEDIILLLKRDLVFGYKMICNFFSKEFLKENDLAKILFNIRTAMSTFKISNEDLVLMCVDPDNDIGGTEYRTHTIRVEKFLSESRSVAFWENTSYPAEIEDDMNKLFEKYKNIYEIIDNNEYVLACYRLTEEFLQIHPYNDGNGRTSKYLFYVLLIKRGIIPFTKTNSNFMPKCYLEDGKSESYIKARQSIFYDRLLEETNVPKRK